MMIQSPNHSHALFMKCCLLIVVSILLIVCCFSKTVSFLGANFFHCSLLDQIFTWYTHLGDGLFAVVLAITCFGLSKKELAIHVLFAFVLSGIIAQLLKKLFHAPRPKAFFSAQVYPYFIEGVTHSGWTSFPSGHTATAFAIATVLSLNTRRCALCLILFCMATLVAYSRVYLGQHFIEDILAGMVTGIYSALFVAYIYGVGIKKIKTAGNSSATAYEQPVIDI